MSEKEETSTSLHTNLQFFTTFSPSWKFILLIPDGRRQLQNIIAHRRTSEKGLLIILLFHLACFNLFNNYYLKAYNILYICLETNSVIII